MNFLRIDYADQRPSRFYVNGTRTSGDTYRDQIDTARHAGRLLHSFVTRTGRDRRGRELVRLFACL